MGLNLGGRFFLGVLYVGCSVLFSTASWATTVEPGEGTLMVNKGQGYWPVKHRTVAKIGESFVVSPGGHATLIYSDGCKADIKPGAVTMVTRLSPCASASYAQSQDTPDYGNHWCVTPPTPLDYGNPSYCMGAPVTAGVLAVFGAIVYEAISP